MTIINGIPNRLVVALSVFCVLGAGCAKHASLDLADPQVKQRMDAKKERPDQALLAKISLPGYASKKEVRNYISAVLSASRNQQAYLISDPQVSLMVEVGHGNLDELLFALRGNDRSLLYVVEAIKALANNDDRAKIIEALEGCPLLAEVVMERGWVKDAQPVLVKKLQGRPGYLPTDWIAAVSSLQDPSTYDDLLAYFANGANKRSTYKHIGRLPDIDLSQAAPLAWERSRGDKYDVAELTEAALSVGYVPALDFVVEALTNNNGMQPSQFSARALMFQFTGIQGSNDELKKWYETNRSRLKFDTAAKKFIVVK